MYTHAPRPCFVMAESSAWNAHSPDLHMPCFLIIFRCLLKYHNLIGRFFSSLVKSPDFKNVILSPSHNANTALPTVTVSVTTQMMVVGSPCVHLVSIL